MKHLKSYCFFILGLACTCYANACEHTGNFNFLQDLNDPTTQDFLDNTHFQHRDINPDEILQLIVFTLKANYLLKDNIYLNTYPLNKKSIIDIPSFSAYREYSRHRIFGAGLFFHQTSRMYFSQHCDGIQAYIAVCSPTLLQRLSNCIECARTIYPQFNIDPLNIFPLFANIAVQERQVGLMLRGDKDFGRCSFHLHVPLLYQERNYYMTQQERDRIEEAFDAVLGTNHRCDESEGSSCTQNTSCTDTSDKVGMHTDKSNPVDMAFVQNHLVGDSFGIGDTRIQCYFDLVKRHYYKMSVGLVATIPTAFSFKKGLFGSWYEDSCYPRDFSLTSVIDQARSGNVEAATELGQDFALGALDQFSRNLLDSGLGYGNHLGIGVSYKTMGRLSCFIKRPWAHYIKMKSILILQYYTPGTEIRAFVEDKNPADYEDDQFDLDRSAHDPVYAQERLDFINRKMIEELYPFRLRTMVHPGFIFQSTTGYYFEIRPWKIQLVNDFWARSSEDFGSICTNPNTPPLAVACAKRPYSVQSRMGAIVAYSFTRPTHAWTLSLYADATYWSKGIGKDFNIVFSIECNF
jgi:hypothetical protein